MVRREPRGPKSLRRSQMQRQRLREAAAAEAAQRKLHHSDNAFSPNSNFSPGSSFHLSPPTSHHDLGGHGPAQLLRDVDDKLKKEIAIMKRLRHRHIVQLKEVIDDAKSKKVFMSSASSFIA